MTDWDDDYSDDADEDQLEVIGPTGTPYPVIHEKEVSYYNEAASRYLHDYRFTNISDLQDLDRVLSLELLSYRYQSWVSLERDYDGQQVDTEELGKSLRELSRELRLMKDSLGMNKKARDKDKGESAAAYIETLRSRAQEFGVKRNEEAVMAITLFMELKAMVTFYNNCTPDERRENQIELSDLFAWVESIIPQFDEIDEKFRESGQKYWVTEL